MVENKPDPVEQALEKLKPLLSGLSFGSVMGYCSGYAFKKVGKAVAFVVGVGFIGLQAVVSTGYIDVNWGKMKEDALKKVDAVSTQSPHDCVGHPSTSRLRNSVVPVSGFARERFIRLQGIS